jgi:hypothetical protein
VVVLVHFPFTSLTDKVVVTNPFVMNPDSPVKVDNFPKVDVILVVTATRTRWAQPMSWP